MYISPALESTFPHSSSLRIHSTTTIYQLSSQTNKLHQELPICVPPPSSLLLCSLWALKCKCHFQLVFFFFPGLSERHTDFVNSVSAAKHDFLICCQRNPSTGVWSPNLALTELVCKALYPNDVCKIFVLLLLQIC